MGTVSRRAVAPSMQVSKKIWTFEGFDDSVLFEAREVSYKRPPVKILSRLNELKISTAVADAGLLSAAEDAGVFSTLENLGAFSLIEKSLPLVEKLGLLSLLEVAFVLGSTALGAALFALAFTVSVLQDDDQDGI